MCPPRSCYVVYIKWSNRMGGPNFEIEDNGGWSSIRGWTQPDLFHVVSNMFQNGLLNHSICVQKGQSLDS